MVAPKGAVVIHGVGKATHRIVSPTTLTYCFQLLCAPLWLDRAQCYPKLSFMEQSRSVILFGLLLSRRLFTFVHPGASQSTAVMTALQTCVVVRTNNTFM